jgi:hypothetical protein
MLGPSVHSGSPQGADLTSCTTPSPYAPSCAYCPNQHVSAQVRIAAPWPVQADLLTDCCFLSCPPCHSVLLSRLPPL